MKIIAMIPARYASTRFPYKLMQPLGTKTVIRHTYENTLQTGLFDEVIVVTDSDIILKEITGHGGKAIMSQEHHECGSDRIAEAIKDMTLDVVVNVQGDEPFVNKSALKGLIDVFYNEKDKVQVASLMKEIKNSKLIDDPNCVKVVVDYSNQSLLFSRSPIPYHRDPEITPVYYEHIGVYAFRKQALLQFTQWPMSPLEAAEKIECLRYLENGIRLKMVVTQESSVKIDVPEDLAKAERFLSGK